MIHVDTLVDLYAHMEWADATVWRTIESNKTLATDDDLRERLFHLHTTQLAFLGVWRGEDIRLRRADEFETLGPIRDEARTFYPAIREMLSRLRDDDLTVPKQVPWAKFFTRHLGREVAVTTLGETMMQVVLHTQHHRAQINTRIRDRGGEPQLIDYIGWLWAGRPAPEW